MHRIGSGSALLALLLLVAAPPTAWTPSEPPSAAIASKHPDILNPDLSKAELCQVAKAAHGDTTTVIRKGKLEKVRLLGVGDAARPRHSPEEVR